MNELHFPWLEIAVGLPLLGSLWVRQLRDREAARRHCVAILAVTFVMTVGAWIDFTAQRIPAAQDSWTHSLGPEILEIDELNAPLMPLASLLFLLKAIATLRTKVRRVSFDWSMIRESAFLGALACRDPWAVIILLALATIPVWVELRSRGEPTRIYTLFMGLFVLAMVLGQLALTFGQGHPALQTLGVGLLMLAVLVRNGVFPFHVWIPDLFSRATFGTAMLFVLPMPGVYAAMRLLLPVAPDWALRGIALMSLFTALYGAGLALVQKEARRFYAYLFLSNSSLVLVGLELATPIGLTGSLSLWLSVGLALGGFGLTLRAVEARIGPFDLTEFRGLYEHMPALAGFFLLTGLASVGFPGTFGFVGAELIVDGAVQFYPLAGMAVVTTSALNGIAILMAYLRIFTGTQHRASISLQILPPERFAVLTLTLLILGGGLWPQPGIASRYHAAMALLNSRKHLSSPLERSGEEPVRPEHADPAAMEHREAAARD
jgi:NADH-quinone oxidoreductase subunit M